MSNIKWSYMDHWRSNGPAGPIDQWHSHKTMSAFLKQTPAALAFLRCGEPLTDERLKPLNQFVCDDLAGK